MITWSPGDHVPLRVLYSAVCVGHQSSVPFGAYLEQEEDLLFRIMMEEGRTYRGR